MKKYFIGIMMIKGVFCYSQKLEGLWQNQDNPNIYDYYDISNVVYDFSGHYTSSVNYGFYSDCSLPSIDSLKHEKTEKYPYYFEVTTDDFKSAKKKSLIDCGELNIFKEGNDTVMQIYYSSRQQFVTYKKVKIIPPKIEQYLKSKGIVIPRSTKSE